MASIGGVLSYFRSHLLLTLPSPTQSFAGQTIIVTGSNTGLGLEAARRLVGLNAEKVILGVRNIGKGERAKDIILESNPSRPTTAVEVWELDHASHASVKAFCARATDTLERLDAVIANAGIVTHDFALVEGNERTITVNFVSQFLLGLLLLPKLRETSNSYNKVTVLTFTGSFVHWLAKFDERKSESILGACRDKKSNMQDRYNVSKLLELFALRQLAAALTRSEKPGKITASILNPGSVLTDLGAPRDSGGRDVHGFGLRAFRRVVGRSPTEGSKTLVHAAGTGRETHGQYLDDCKVGRVSDFVKSPDGVEAQVKVWKELLQVLEETQPGVSSNI